MAASTSGSLSLNVPSESTIERHIARNIPLPALAPHEFGILSHNVNKSQDSQADLVRIGLDDRQWHGILIQEPNDRRTKRLRTPGYNLIYDKVQGQPLSVYAYVREDVSIRRPEFNCSCSAEKRAKHEAHIMTSTLDLPDGQVLNITDVYNRKGKISSTCMASAFGADGMHLIAGDWNLHHPDWDESKPYPNSYARTLQGMMKPAFCLLDKKGEYIWTQRSRNGYNQSVIDLAWISNEFANPVSMRLLPEVSRSTADHKPVEIVLSLRVKKPGERRPCWGRVKPEAFTEDLEEFLAPLDNIVADGPATDDNYAAQLFACITSCIEKCVPHCPPGSKAKPEVMTPELVVLQKDMKEARARSNKVERAMRKELRRTTYPGIRGHCLRVIDDCKQECKCAEAEFDRVHSDEIPKHWRMVFVNRVSTIHRLSKYARRRQEDREPPTMPILMDENDLPLRTGKEQVAGRRPSSSSVLSAGLFDPVGVFL